ncbi:zinc finger protein 112 [Trichonephila clavipes]|nr:zinc finger protein 112 [Trichonephila clavipes]
METGFSRFFRSSVRDAEIILRGGQRIISEINILVENSQGSSQIPKSNPHLLNAEIKKKIARHENIKSMSFTRNGKIRFSTLDPAPMIIGDFNLHHPMWGSDHISRYSNEFVEWITDSNLVLHNTTVPTYRSSAETLAICQALDDLVESNVNLLVLSDSLSVLSALQNFSIKSHKDIKFRLYSLDKSSAMSNCIANEKKKTKTLIRGQQSNMQPDLRRQVCEHSICFLQHQVCSVLDKRNTIVPLWHGDTLNSHRAASPLVRLVEREEIWEASDHLRMLSLKIGVEPSRIVLSPMDTKKSIYMCQECKKTFSFRCKLILHLRSHTNEKPYTCEICKNRFSNNSNLKAHLLIHTKEKPFVCEICNKAFSRSSVLKEHMRSHSNEKPYVCEKCEMAFSRGSTLRIHLRIHTNEKPYVCEVCEMAFSTKYTLRKHERIHTKERPYICDTCGKAFSDCGVLNRHLLIHTKEKPYACEICKKTFTRNNTLRIHMRIHSNEKPYVCEICDKAYSAKCALKKHVRIHSNIKPFICEFCAKGFNQLSNLNAHLLTHSNEKPYVCEICKMTFGQSRNLRRHLHIHTDEKPYICEICNKAFSQNDALKRHWNQWLSILSETGIEVNTRNCSECYWSIKKCHSKTLESIPKNRAMESGQGRSRATSANKDRCILVEPEEPMRTQIQRQFLLAPRRRVTSQTLRIGFIRVVCMDVGQ